MTSASAQITAMEMCLFELLQEVGTAEFKQIAALAKWTEQAPNPVQPTESTLALSFLHEDIQDVRQTNRRIDDLAKQLDSRYARLMAMLIACTGILVTTMGAAVAVLKFSFS